MMQANIKMIIENNFDKAATLTAVPNMVAAKPLSNVQQGKRSSARSMDMTQSIRATWDTPQTGGGIAIARYTYSPTSTITIIRKFQGATQLEADFNLGVEMIPVGQWRVGVDEFGGLADPNRDRIAAMFHDEEILYDETLINIYDPDNTTGFNDLGRIFDGRVVSPRKNFALGATLGYIDNVDHIETSSGSLRSIGNKRQRRQLDLEFKNLNETDRIAQEIAFSARTRDRDMFIAAYPSKGGIIEGRHMMICKRVNHAEFTHVHTHQHRLSMTFLET